MRPGNVGQNSPARPGQESSALPFFTMTSYPQKPTILPPTSLGKRKVKLDRTHLRLSFSFDVLEATLKRKNKGAQSLAKKEEGKNKRKKRAHIARSTCRPWGSVWCNSSAMRAATGPKLLGKPTATLGREPRKAGVANSALFLPGRGGELDDMAPGFCGGDGS